MLDPTQNSLVRQRIKDTSSDSTMDVGFETIFETFASRVLPELSQINLLFDEYTPHDVTHMDSLFRIADLLLGSERINKLNGCEACIIGCALYGHDWGMAVSGDERDLIVTGVVPVGRNREEFALLDDEQQCWAKFAKSVGLEVNDAGYVNDSSVISKDTWREYVRQTHADRAYARALHCFSGDQAPLGRLVGEVCAGHWYDISQIRQLPTSRSVAGQVINLRALAVYVRFIDLLDIGYNRTPYSLWKFVNPRNATSAIEWKKHQALSPVTIDGPDDSNSYRKIRIHGEIEDHRVYAALEDLRRYCRSQIEENEATLLELGQYSLGPLALDWSVDPIGFEPIDIRFEFDRERMFELVSGEIYDGDPYVFLRELLQNGIDATSLRQARYKSENASLDGLFISVVVKHKANGDAIIRVSDEGAGMSVSIVRDYLAKSGKSYYQSKEFHDLEIDMNPISRFGIGLLSCFEVANAMCIETQTDPKYGESTGLRIEIADRAQQFRIEPLSEGRCPIGTTVTVYVRGSKWRKNEFEGCSRLRVTDYIKAISGFSPYAIHIVENYIETVICPVDASKTMIQRFRSKFPNAEIWKESYAFNLEEVVAAQDQEHAALVFAQREKVFKRTVGGIQLKGAISYFVPSDKVVFSQRRVQGVGSGASFFCNFDGQLGCTQIRWTQNSANTKPEGISESAKRSIFNRVYLRGILVPDLDLALKSGGDGTPSPRVTVNIDCDSESIIPLLSRRGVRNTVDRIRNTISTVFHKEIRNQYSSQFNTANPLDRLVIMGRLARYIAHPLLLENCFAISEWPVVLLDRIGHLSGDLMHNLPDSIEIVPKFFMQQRKHRAALWPPSDWMGVPLPQAEQLVGVEDSMVVMDFGFEYDDGSAMEWNTMDHCLRHAIANQYKITGIRIARIESQPYPLIIERWEKGTTTIQEPTPALGVHQFEFLSFDDQSNDVFCILELQNNQLSQNHVGKLIYNVHHPVAALLERVMVAVRAQIDNLDPLVAGRLRDEFSSLPLVGYSLSYNRPGYLEACIQGWVPRFCNWVADHGLVELSADDKECLTGQLPIFPCFE